MHAEATAVWPRILARSRAASFKVGIRRALGVLSDKTDNRPAFIRLRLHFVNSYGCSRLSVIYETCGRAIDSEHSHETVSHVGKHVVVIEMARITPMMPRRWAR